MRNYISWPVLILIISAGGYWITRTELPVADKENAIVSVAIKEENLSRVVRSPDTNSQPRLPFSNQLAFPWQANKEVQTYDPNDPIDREQLAASLRAEGLLEADIQNILKGSTEEPPPTAIESSVEPKAYDPSDPVDREQLAASLRAEGIIGEEIKKILRNLPANEPLQDQYQSQSPSR